MQTEEHQSRLMGERSKSNLNLRTGANGSQVGTPLPQRTPQQKVPPKYEHHSAVRPVQQGSYPPLMGNYNSTSMPNLAKPLQS